MESASLSVEERELCGLVARAAAVNHFSRERFELDCAIAQMPASTPTRKVFAEVMSRVKALTLALEKRGIANIEAFKGEDLVRIEFTFLFEIFHIFLENFDQHILAQVKKGETPLEVPFWPKALAMFRKRGFRDVSALSFFEIFFQFRRAYFFIEERLVGKCPSMMMLRQNLWNNVFTSDLFLYQDNLLNRMEDFSTLILGGTGTGKGTAAAAIGRSGHIPFDPKNMKFTESFTRAFVSINLSQYPESLLESELFGHRKGAFTGAIEAHEGVFQRCSQHGATFLDEIGDVSIPTQIKLLQVLQERTFSPVGSHEKMRFHGRVIGATNRNIPELRRTGKFREDFYYRLCSDTIVVPPLYKRIQENPFELDDLIAYVVRSIVGKDLPEFCHKVKTVVDKNLGMNYQWPGNVRELEQCVRRIIIKQDYKPETSDLKINPLEGFTEELGNDEIDAGSLLERYCKYLYEKYRSYQTVARITALDRRTVKKYVDNAGTMTENKIA